MLETTSMSSWTELAMALANATEGEARATVLRITQTERSHGFVAWQALVDGYAPKSSNDPAIELQPTLATPERCKDAKELKERRTAWSLKVAEYEHQFKTIDEVQKILVAREMMPKDIKREFLTGPRKFDEIMEKLEIIVNEMMADDGLVPMELGNAGTHDTKTTQNDSDTSNDMSYEDVCAMSWKGYKAGKGAGKKGPNGSGTWHHGKGADEWPSGKRYYGGKKGAPRVANPIGQPLLIFFQWFFCCSGGLAHPCSRLLHPSDCVFGVDPGMPMCASAFASQPYSDLSRVGYRSHTRVDKSWSSIVTRGQPERAQVRYSCCRPWHGHDLSHALHSRVHV